MKLTSTIYQTIVKVYGLLPFQKQICHFLRATGIPSDSFYKDLQFKGEFLVSMDDEHSFSMIHHKSTIENETFWKGPFNSWETHTGWIWQQLCPISNNVLDIGANTGIYSLVAKSLNPNATIVAFEPTVRTFKKLKANVELNEWDIKVEQLAVSNKNEKQTLYDTPEENQTSASLSAKKLKDFELYTGGIVEYDVESTRLDDYLKQHGINEVDLIKLDIEMHEGEAIEGLGELLYSLRPVVVIEVLSDEVANKLNSMINSDFEIFHLEGHQKVKRVEEFKVVMGKWNYLFFHKDLIEKMKRSTSLYQ